MTIRPLAIAALAVALASPCVRAGAMAECEVAGDRNAVLKCLSDLDLETLAALKRVETAAGRAAREIEVTTKQPGAYTAFASSSRAFALYQQAQCDYVRALQPDARVRPTSAAPSPADLAKIACRIDLARDRIDLLK
jgi:hypothetical protein